VAGKKTQPKAEQTPKQASNGLAASGGIAVLISSIGVLMAFGILWWQIILQPGVAQQQLRQQQLLQNYAQLFNGQVTDLQATVDAMATATTTVAAFSSHDPAQRQQTSQMLTEQHPYVVRVEIIDNGAAEVDLNAEVPISFAALDLIRRAESSSFVGPEVGPNQGGRLYAAQPIAAADGSSGGVLLVVFDRDFLVGPLQHVTELRGTLEVLQTVQGSPTTPVLSAGGASGDLPAIQEQLLAPHWSVSFAAAAAEVTPTDYTSSLYVPLAFALVFIFAGVAAGLTHFLRAVKADFTAITVYAVRLLRGRGAHPGRYRLAPTQAMAEAISVYAKTPTEGDAVEAGEGDADPLVADVDVAADTPTEDGEQNTEQNTADDFLDVSAAKPHDNFGIEVTEDVGPTEIGVEFDAGIFRAYDIRGITTSNLTEDVVYWIGRAFAAEALAKSQSRVAVGRDGRHSSEPLQTSLTRGLTEGGVDVMCIGEVPTPVLYYATHVLDTGTGIMITGSHNPPEYNGLKMMIGGVTLAEDMIQELYRRLCDNDLSEGEGESEQINVSDSYIDKVLEDVAVAQPPKVVVDCGNGVAGSLAPRLLRELGCEVIELYCEVDGDFPNHHPDPAEPENLEDLQTVVQAENADIGLAFDGDGDRLGVVTNSGNIIWPDKVIMLFAQDIVSRNPGADIIYDVKCSRHLNTIISDLGGRPIMWKTGHSHMKAKLKETGALLAGEFSGHICFGERWYGFDDALYSAVRLMEILGSEAGTSDQVFEQFPTTFTTPEIKITTTESEKFKIMEQLNAQADFGEGTLTTIDGIRVDFSDGWGLIRPSNTSPVLSLRFEADDSAALDRIQDEFQAELSAIDSTLTFR